MMQVVCCQLAVRLETGTLGLATERTSDGAWVESSVSSACLVRCVALELRGEVLAFVFIMYQPDPETRFGGRRHRWCTDGTGDGDNDTKEKGQDAQRDYALQREQIPLCVIMDPAIISLVFILSVSVLRQISLLQWSQVEPSFQSWAPSWGALSDFKEY